MKIAVLGSGNGGCAVAFDWARFGHNVSLFDFEEFSANIDAINKNGGIYSEGEMEGFSKLEYAGNDIEKTLEGADIIFVVGPAYSTEAFGKICSPYIKRGQRIIVCPGSCCGSIVFKKASGFDIDNQEVVVSETSTLPYAVRMMEPGKIHVFLRLKGGVYIASLPAKFTDETIKLISEVFPYMLPAKNVFQTALQNANPIIHPAVTLLNSGLIERTNGGFYFYEDGVTKAVGRLIEALDNERIEIGKKLGIEIIRDPVLGMKQGYMQEATYDKGYSEANGFKGIRAQGSLDYRYFNEDVGYGLIFMADLGKKAGVETPAMDSVINIVSTIMNRNYRQEKKRCMESMGLKDYTLDQLIEIL